MVRIFTRNLVAIEYRNLVLAASHHLLVILLPVSRDIGLLRLPEQNNRPRGFLGGSDRKESVCNAGDLGLVPGLGRSPRRRVWQLTPVSLPGKVHGQRSLAGYSPRGHKELDMTEPLCTHTGWETRSRPEVHSTGSQCVFLQQHPGGCSHSSTTPQQYIMKT